MVHWCLCWEGSDIDLRSRCMVAGQWDLYQACSVLDGSGWVEVDQMVVAWTSTGHWAEMLSVEDRAGCCYRESMSDSGGRLHSQEESRSC